MRGMAKGMATVMRHLLKPAFTEDYPWGERTLPERSRMSFTLPLDDNGVPYCKSCMLCAKSCPDQAITIESSKREDGPGRVLERFEIDLGVCMFCGICVENCPSSGLASTGDFETAAVCREDTRLLLYATEPAGPVAPAGSAPDAAPAPPGAPPAGGEAS